MWIWYRLWLNKFDIIIILKINESDKPTTSKVVSQNQIDRFGVYIK